MEQEDRFPRPIEVQSEELHTCSINLTPGTLSHALEATAGMARIGFRCRSDAVPDAPWVLVTSSLFETSSSSLCVTDVSLRSGSGTMWQCVGSERKEATVDWYLPLKLVHVVSAIVAVGTNVTYFVFLRAMRGRPQPEQSFILGTITWLDSHLANPGYVVLPITGVAMVLVGDLGFTTFWIAVAIGLYILVGVFAGVLFAPALRRLAEIVDAEDAGPTEYAAAWRRTGINGLVTMLPVAGILYLMVMQPTP